MRTKTLLTAAAALAVGVLSSKAQVYSQNIVGYANVPTPTASAQYLVSVPFVVGVSNGANEIFGSSLPDGSTILTWSVANNNYTAYISDSGSPTLWDDADFNPVPAPVLPVGQGFFLSPSAPVTNTFIGSVAVSVGTSNVMTFPTGSAQYLVGSVVPYSGSLTNGTSSGGGLNLNGLPDGSTILTWSVANNNYTAYISDSGSPTLWDDADFNPVPAPEIGVGEGFFVSPSADDATWTVGL